MAFCTQCGQKASDADQFCANCGARQGGVGATFGAGPYSPPRAPGQDPLSTVSPRVASVLCYIPTVGWIFAVIVLAARRFKTENTVRFHAFQGLYLFAAWLMVQWVIRPMSVAIDHSGFRVYHLLEAVLVVTSIFMMFKASRDEAYVLPIIGELAQRSAVEQ